MCHIGILCCCRIVINTYSNVVSFNFEPLEYDYTAEQGALAQRQKFARFCMASMRHQPHSYIRAQRMKAAGPRSTRILQLVDEASLSKSRPGQPSQQRVQSSLVTSLAKRSLLHAHAQRRTQSAMPSANRRVSTLSAQALNGAPFNRDKLTELKAKFEAASWNITNRRQFLSTQSSITPRTTAPRIRTQANSSAAKPEVKSRRVSWAFDKPHVPKESKALGLDETKALLRSQIRAKGKVTPPDFISNAVSAIQDSLKPLEEKLSSESLEKRQSSFGSKRPSSSPSRIDSQTKIPLDDSQWLAISQTGQQEEEVDVPLKASVSRDSSEEEGDAPLKASVSRDSSENDDDGIELSSPTRIRHQESSTSQEQDARPHTVPAPHRGSRESREKRPMSSNVALNGTEISEDDWDTEEPLSYWTQRINYQNLNVPVLMYSQEMKKTISDLPERRREISSKYERLASPLTCPIRTHVDLNLRTHDQMEQKYI